MKIEAQVSNCRDDNQVSTLYTKAFLNKLYHHWLNMYHRRCKIFVFNTMAAIIEKGL